MDDFSQFLGGSDTTSKPSITNVGNIRPVGSTTGFQKYDTPEAGIKAIDDQLRIYGQKHGIHTLRGVIERWAPSSENDTESYIKEVSQRTGIKPDEDIDIANNPVIRHIISGPIVLREQGLNKLKSQPASEQLQIQTQTTQEPKDDFNSFLAGTEEKPTLAKPAEKTKPFFDKSRNESTINAYDIIPGAPLYEAALHGITGAGAQLAGNVIGAVKHYGERGTAAEEEAAKIAEQYTYQPRGQIIKKVLPAVTEKVANAIEESKLGPLLMQPELLGVGEFAKPVAEQAGIGKAAETLKEQFDKKLIMPEETKTTSQEFNTQSNEEGSAKPYDSSKDFNELHYSESSLPKDEQQARLETLHRIDPNLKVDPNVIEGRGKERATDYELSKTDTPEGNVLSEKENEYKTSLNNYGEKIITDTGGTVGLDETSNYRRGEKTLDYFQKLENHFNDKLTKIYKERDAIAKDIPVNGENISNALKDESLTTLNSESEGLAKAAKAKLKSLHMMDNEGNMLPSNGMQAEKFRQWLNENNVWSNKNASLHRALKDSVDADVISTLDPNTSIYKEARELFVLKKNTLENPNGISKILDAEGPNKINRKIDIENIPNSITKMGVNQFTHILDTIKNAPPELQSAANESMAQIKSHFLNQAHAEFQRSASAGTKYLKANREVMTRLFNPEEMSKINDYNSAAHILKVDTRYKGAYVQKTNLEPRLTTKIGNQILKKGAAIGAEALTGGLTHGIAAATAHEVIGGKIAKSEAKSLEKILQENARKKQTGFTNLQDIMNTGKKE